MLYESSSSTSKCDMSSGKSSIYIASDASLPLKAMEAVMNPSMVQKYNHRYTRCFERYFSLSTEKSKPRTKNAIPNHFKLSLND